MNAAELIAAAEASSSVDPHNSGQLLQAAELCVQAGEHARAEALARRAAGIAPQNSRVQRVLSGILSLGEHWEEAIEIGLLAVRLRPDDAECRLHAASLLIGSGAWRQAAEQLVAYVALPAPRPVGWRLLSSALQELGRSARAMEAVDRAIALAPEIAEYRVHRASLLAASGRYGDALAELHLAARQDPGDASIWRSLSGILEVLHEWGEAETAAERAVALAPADPALQAHLWHVRGLLGVGSETVEPISAAEGPGYWTDRPQRQPSPRVAHGFLGLLGIQARIVVALMLREMRTRFGRTRLGYIWAILEPISHIATLGSVFSLLNHAPPPVGAHLFLFYLTGLMPFLMFGHVSNEVMASFAANAPVLQIPLIKRIDVILARALLHLATEVLVGMVVFGGAALIGWQGMPADVLTTMAAVIALWLMATGIGALNIVITELMPSWDTFFAALVRVLYFASGIYYSPIAMPQVVRNVLVWNPILQAVEWFRSGFFAGYEPHWLMRGYVLIWALGALLLGLASERALRRHVPVVA